MRLKSNSFLKVTVLQSLRMALGKYSSISAYLSVIIIGSSVLSGYICKGSRGAESCPKHKFQDLCCFSGVGFRVICTSAYTASL